VQEVPDYVHSSSLVEDILQVADDCILRETGSHDVMMEEVAAQAHNKVPRSRSHRCTALPYHSGHYAEFRTLATALAAWHILEEIRRNSAADKGRQEAVALAWV